MSNQSETPFNITLLKELNRVMQVELIPVTVYLALLMLLGLVGNLLVIVVFGWKLKASTQNCLFMWLGVFDLISCVVGMPAEMLDISHYYLYEDKVACKVLKFLLATTPIASANLLVIIAVDRFRRVCRPLHLQMEVAHARVGVGVSAAVAVVVAGPALSLYGNRTVPTSVPGLKGCDCSVQDKYQGRLYPLLYEAVFGLAFLVYAGVLAWLYGRVWLEARRHRRYMASHCISSGTLTSLLPPPTTTSEGDDSSCYNTSSESPDFAARRGRRTPVGDDARRTTVRNTRGTLTSLPPLECDDGSDSPDAARRRTPVGDARRTTVRNTQGALMSPPLGEGDDSHNTNDDSHNTNDDSYNTSSESPDAARRRTPVGDARRTTIENTQWEASPSAEEADRSAGTEAGGRAGVSEDTQRTIQNTQRKASSSAEKVEHCAGTEAEPRAGVSEDAQRTTNHNTPCEAPLAPNGSNFHSVPVEEAERCADSEAWSERRCAETEDWATAGVSEDNRRTAFQNTHRNASFNSTSAKVAEGCVVTGARTKAKADVSGNVPLNTIHYTVPLNTIHYTVPLNTIHYTPGKASLEPDGPNALSAAGCFMGDNPCGTPPSGQHQPLGDPNGCENTSRESQTTSSRFQLAPKNTPTEAPQNSSCKANGCAVDSGNSRKTSRGKQYQLVPQNTPEYPDPNDSSRDGCDNTSEDSRNISRCIQFQLVPSKDPDPPSDCSPPRKKTSMVVSGDCDNNSRKTSRSIQFQLVPPEDPDTSGCSPSRKKTSMVVSGDCDNNSRKTSRSIQFQLVSPEDPDTSDCSPSRKKTSMVVDCDNNSRKTSRSIQFQLVPQNTPEYQDFSECSPSSTRKKKKKKKNKKKNEPAGASSSVSISSRASNSSSVGSQREVYVKMRKSLRANKLTVLAVAVTLIFVVSYLPHLSLILLRTVSEDLDHRLRGSGLVLYNVFLRSYFFNSVANVLVYGLMNVQFQRQCRLLCRCCCAKMSSDAESRV